MLPLTLHRTQEFLKRYHLRSKRQTGIELKIVATDSGTAFNGEFLAYLASEGIIKRKGQRYDILWRGYADSLLSVESLEIKRV